MIKSSEIIKIQVAFKSARSCTDALYLADSRASQRCSPSPMTMFNMFGEGVMPAGVT